LGVLYCNVNQRQWTISDVSAASFALIFKAYTFHNSRPVHNTGKYNVSEVLDDKKQWG
jgi:hypothetical protein